MATGKWSRIVEYDPKYRSALLELSLRAWEPVFPILEGQVPPFVYRSFYPNGWRERQRKDLAEILDSEPQSIDVAVDGDRPIG